MIIDGKKIAEQIRSKLEKKIASLKGRKPGLAFVLVGDDPASHTYIQMKKRACKKIGFLSKDLVLPASISEKGLLQQIDTLNQDANIDGILVQLPLPKSIQETVILQKIDPTKDVDGFHPINFGKLLLGDETGFVPCTPLGIQTLLKEMNIETAKKHLVIVGRSNLVGKPLAALMMQKKEHSNATVTVAHSQTKDLESVTKQADILVVAIGSPQLIQERHVKKGAVVIDVGINRDANNAITGDVDYEAVRDKASFITPVPGGVGPMTIAMLLQNTFESFLKHRS